MAQVNIAHFTEIPADESRDFAVLARDVAAKEVHGLEKSQMQPDSVSVLVFPLDAAASVSGADTEVQVLVSGNDWPLTVAGQPATAAEAKAHFDELAAKMYRALQAETSRKLYIWVTPFTASGWAEGE